MSAFFSLTSNAQGAEELVLVDGPPYEPWVLVGKDIGSPSWAHTMSGPRGSQGRRAANGIPDDRLAAFTLLVDEAADKDVLAEYLADLASVIDEIRRYGGRITFREHEQTHKQTLVATVGSLEVSEWGQQEYELRNCQRPAITFTCSPYIEGAQMDVVEDFATDTITGGDWTALTGALGEVLIVTGALTAVSTLDSTKRLIHTGTGYSLGDHEVEAKITPGSTLNGFRGGVILKQIDNDNWIECAVIDNGATSSMSIRTYVAGVPSETTDALVSRIISGTPFWIRGRITGGLVELTYHTSDPAFLAPDAAVDSMTAVPLDFAIADEIAPLGQAGIVWVPKHSGAKIEAFRVRPFVDQPTAGLVETAEFWGPIPGDASAIADVEMAVDAVAADYPWALFAWWERPRPYNLVIDGDFPTLSSGRWTHAAVSGFMGAGTSVAVYPVVPGRYGPNALTVVCPATANTGAKTPIYGRFKKGETYTARAWVRAPSATTAVRLRVGVPSGDIGSSSAVALSTTWTLHTATVTLTADASVMYVGQEITAATGTTFHLDAVTVNRGTLALTGRQGQGAGAYPPFGVFEGETGDGGALTTTADATASGGNRSGKTSISGSGDLLIWQWNIDPSLVSADDYSDGSLAITYFARVLLSAAFDGGVAASIAAYPVGQDPPVYPNEWGSMPIPLALPSSGNAKWRTVRLGTLVLPIDQRHAARPSENVHWAIQFRLDVEAGTNAQALALDYLAAVPARGHVAGPTAKPTTGYPVFLPTTAVPQARLIHSDMAGSRSVNGGPFSRYAGISGSMVELPAGEVETLALVSSMIPDDPTASASSEAILRPRVHLRVTPRWSYIREKRVGG